MSRQMTKRVASNLKKGDLVVVIAGKDRGKTGRILQMLPVKNAVLVEKVNMIKRHTKPQKDKEGGIVEKEAPIHASNVMFYDRDKGVRIGKKFLEDGRKVRIARGSGEVLDK